MSGRLSKDYWLLWAGSAVSNLGDGVRLAALPLLAATLTRDPFPISLVTAITVAPWLLLGLFIGPVIDRKDRRKLMMWGQFVRSAVVAGFAVVVALDQATMTHIYVVAAIIGLGEVVVDSSSQAAIPMLAEDADLEKANGRMIAAHLVFENFVGSPIGAVLFVVAAAIPFGADAATYLAGGLLIAVISTPLQEPKEARESSIAADITEGLRFVWNYPLLRGLALAVALAGVAIGLGHSILVLYALEILEMAEEGYGLLLAVAAAGGFIGSMSAGRVAMRLGRRGALLLGALLMILSQLLLGIAPGVIVAGLGVLLTGLGRTMFAVVGQSIRQRATPDRLLGRVVTSFRMIAVGGLPLGAVAGGLIAAATTLRVPFLIGAALGIGFTLVTYRVATTERIRAVGSL